MALLEPVGNAGAKTVLITGVNAGAKTVLITGVSRGCGRAMAIELARRGHTIIGVARSEEKLTSLREECPRPNGQHHLFSTLDVTFDAGVKEFAQQVLKDGLVPDIVVNNAAVGSPYSKIWDVPVKEVDVILDTNIKGTINVLRHFLPILIEKGHGVVVNVSSSLGRSAIPYAAPYCTTKWAIEGLSRSVAMEVHPGITIVTLDPGVIQTDMVVRAFGGRASVFPKPEVWAPAAVDTILNITTEDNGSPLTMTVDVQTSSSFKAILDDFSKTIH